MSDMLDALYEANGYYPDAEDDNTNATEELPADHEPDNLWCSCRNCCCRNGMCTHGE